MSLVASLFSASISSAAADQLAFAVDNTENLFSVNLTTATATPIGFTGAVSAGLGGLASGQSVRNGFPGKPIFGQQDHRRDDVDRQVTSSSTPVGDIEGLAFRGTTLIGTNFSNLGGPTTVYAIDTTTAAADPDHQLFAGPGARDGRAEPEHDRRRQ